MKNNIKLTGIICMLLAVCMLMGCATKEAVNLGVDTETKGQNTPTEAPSTAESEPATEQTDATSEAPSEEPTEAPTEEPTEAPTEKPTEPPNPQAGRPVEPVVQNKYDTFVTDTITMNNSDYVISSEAEQGLYDLISEYSGYDVAFYVVDLESGMSFGYNADQYFEPACTRKAGLALSWFKVLEETRIKKENGQTIYKGENTLTMDSRYYYDGYDYMDGAGYLGRHGYRWYTIQEVMYYLIHESDNTSYKAMWRLMGFDKYKALCIRLGIPEHPNEYRRDKLWTPMRALDLGLVWQEIWKYKDTGSPEAVAMWDYLTHNMFNQIAKVVDADVIAHKSGMDEWGYHDAGIVVRGDDAYAVVALSTVPLSIVNKDYDVIHKIFERVDLIMQDYYTWYGENTEEAES